MGALGAVLKASWEVLGRSWRRMRGVLEAPWAVLEPSWELWRPCWSLSQFPSGALKSNPFHFKSFHFRTKSIHFQRLEAGGYEDLRPVNKSAAPGSGEGLGRG